MTSVQLLGEKWGKPLERGCAGHDLGESWDRTAGEWASVGFIIF